MLRDESLTVADVAALGGLLEQNQERLLAMIRRRMDPALAARIDPEDILSEAFLEAHRKWHRFKAQSEMSAYAWLYRIVLDRLIDVWRRETRGARDHRLEIPWPERSSLQLGLRLIAGTTSPSKAAEREELRQRIQHAMESLSARDQEILWMRAFDQLSFRDIAMVLGATENAVTVRYARALRRLKDVWRRIHESAEIVDGSYAVSQNQGPFLGVHKVEIRALRKTGKKVPNPGPGGDRFVDEVVNAIPAKYNTATTLQVDIQAGRNVADFRLQSR